MVVLELLKSDHAAEFETQAMPSNWAEGRGFINNCRVETETCQVARNAGEHQLSSLQALEFITASTDAAASRGPGRFEQ